MRVLLIILIIVIGISLLRLGVSLKYSDSGFTAVLTVAFLHFTLYPAKGSPRKKRKKKGKPDKKKDELEEQKPEGQKGGGTEQFKQWFRIGMDVLRKLRRRLRVNMLQVRHVVAGEDAAKTAIAYGNTCAAVAAILPGLNNLLSIRRQDIKIDVDFTGRASKIYVNVIISLAVWEIIYIAGSLMIPIIQKGLLGKRNAKKKGGI